MVSNNFRFPGILTLAMFLGISTMQSQVQQFASLLKFTADRRIPVSPNPKQYNSTNSLVCMDQTPVGQKQTWTGAETGT